MKTGIIFGFVLLSFIFLGCVEQTAPQPNVTHNITPPGPITQPNITPTDNATLDIPTTNLSGVQTEESSFVKYYSLDSLNVSLDAPQYDLPLQTNDISNYDDFSDKISLSDEEKESLKKNGFVVIDNPFYSKEEDITAPYKTLKQRGIPIFITSDSLLHLYHIQFDETLRQIEEREFYDDIWNISKKMLDDSVDKYNAASGEQKEAAKRNVAYFSVALELLKPKPEQLCQSEHEWECDAYFKPRELNKYQFAIPDFVKSDVETELDLIEEHKSFAQSPIFIYNEDYSQYIPRGHYTRSEKLKNYFKAIMWYGRMSMLLKGSDDIPPGGTNQFDPKGLISTYDARIQTISASLIASKFAENQELRDKWERIYTVTAFYVGFSDDLGPYEYIDAMGEVFNDSFDPNSLTQENIGELKAELAEYRTPQIFGGTGDCGIAPPFNPEQADKCLEKTKGMRLMGQRFIPDSYMFQNLVFPKVGSYLGAEEPFTLRQDANAGPIRDPPTGLDVMALLGSQRAKELLDESDDSNYVNYTVQFNLLKNEFDSFDDAEWNKNLYWSWLHTLKPLLKEFGPGYPTFMQTKAWQDKELTTSLASWTELRHDTILYAKQSYGYATRSAPMPKPEVVGYVEPVPEFYNRLLAQTRMTNKGLSEMDALDDSAKHRLDHLETILERLRDLSEKELRNEELTEKDYLFIKNFGEQLNGVIAEVDEKAKKTTIVADVHTAGPDLNFGNDRPILEEGVGYVDMMVVAYKVPDGRILVGAGPVMTYYEFKQPMKEGRLTDEKWREMLENGEQPDEFMERFKK